MPPSPPVRTQAAPLSITRFCPVSNQIGYDKRIPTLPRSSCAPPLSLFAGPSPGTCARCHGRRHSSSSAMLRHCFSSTSPTPSLSRSSRSYRTSSSPAKPSPPARTPQTNMPATVVGSQGPICNIVFCSRVPCTRNRGPLCKTPS
jgi:hypothetical protein